MTTLVQSPLQTLQLNIKELYAPMLIKDKQVFNQLDPQTRATLEALDSALEAAVQLGMKKEHGHDEDDFANILTPHDECQHWKLIDGGMMPAASSDQRGRARQYWDILRPLADQIAMLHELPMQLRGFELGGPPGHVPPRPRLWPFIWPRFIADLHGRGAPHAVQQVQ